MPNSDLHRSLCVPGYAICESHTSDVPFWRLCSTQVGAAALRCPNGGFNASLSTNPTGLAILTVIPTRRAMDALVSESVRRCVDQPDCHGVAKTGKQCGCCTPALSAFARLRWRSYWTADAQHAPARALIPKLSWDGHPVRTERWPVKADTAGTAVGCRGGTYKKA